MKNQTILVFGATGNLGAYSAVELKKEGYNVIAIGKRISDNGFFETHNIPYISIDILKTGDFKKLPQENIYAVLHFAGALPSRYEYNPKDLLESITIGTLNILEYMKAVKCSKIIFPQTPFDLWYLHNKTELITADAKRSFPLTGDHSVYTIAKNAAVDLIEHYHASYGFSRFILRFFTIYQYHPNPYHYGDFVKKMMPYRILIDRALKSEEIEVWGDPNRYKEIVYIKDFTQVVSLCISSQLEGGIYNIGGDKAVTLDEQIQGIIDVFSPKNKPSTKKYCPEKPDSLVAKFDISKTKKELGYQPKYSYKDAMTDFYKEMKDEPFAKLWGTKEDYLS